ncbi:murein hydrolase activator EnvC family protein [Clostridium paraputrificum]|uniref:murein hydrolase activator EnvC family protein n=1 Tax=Clostridium paraputrificum TaxID=29363 RepID=UPI003D32D6C4
MKKKAIYLLTGLVVINSLVFYFENPIYTYSVDKDAKEKIDKLNEAGKNLDEAQRKRKEVEKETVEIQNKIDEVQNKLNELQNSIDVIEKDNKRIDEEIDEIQKEIEESYELIRSVMRIEYEQKSGGYIALVLESKDFTSFIRRLEVVSKLVKDNNAIINEIKALEKDLNTKKEKLSAQISELDEKKLQIQPERDSLQVLMDENSKKVAELIELQKNIGADMMLTASEIEGIELTGDKIDKEIVDLTGDGTYEGEMTWPVPGYNDISSPFGYRVHPISGLVKLHTGIDIPAPAGTEVIAANSGKVIISRYNESYGNMIVIDHGSGIVTLYAHNTQRLVKVGDVVTKGQVISLVGTTGNSTGNHCHFEVKEDGRTVNPMGYLQ